MTGEKILAFLTTISFIISAMLFVFDYDHNLTNWAIVAAFGTGLNFGLAIFAWHILHIEKQGRLL